MELECLAELPFHSSDLGVQHVLSRGSRDKRCPFTSPPYPFSFSSSPSLFLPLSLSVSIDRIIYDRRKDAAGKDVLLKKGGTINRFYDRAEFHRFMFRNAFLLVPSVDQW